jgi:putative transposase
MARLARVVAPGYPHHVTQRGTRRQNTFFCEDDYADYRHLMAEFCGKCGTDVWAYCLMPNHVHMIMVPRDTDGLRCAMGEAHRRYTRKINLREGWRGHLWQERFHSFVMDEPHLLAAARYVETNPVRAGLCPQAEHWAWSSASAHLRGQDDELVRVAPLLGMISDWGTYLRASNDAALPEAIHRHARTGRPLGADAFVAELERSLHRTLRPRRRGPRPTQGLTATGDPFPQARED